MQNNTITITVEGRKLNVEKGSSIERVKEGFYPNSNVIIVAAYVNNKLRELTYSYNRGV